MKIVDMPKIEVKDFNDLVEFYVALGAKATSTVQTNKVRMNPVDFKKIHGVIVEFCKTNNWNTVAIMNCTMYSVPHKDESVPVGKVKLINGWIVRG